MRIPAFTFILCLSFNYLFGQEISSVFDSLDIEEVMISASRSNPKDPVTIQNISIKEIEKIYTGQDPSVLIQQLSPSIVSYSDAGTDIGNYAQFRMRGISQSRINVTLNGVPLNDMVDQGVFFSNFSDFSNSIESIQIQRGVGASSVGVASYGGAVNFQSTNIFTGEADTKLELTTGSFGTLRTSGEVKTGLMSNDIGAYGRFTRTAVDGYKTHSASDSYSLFGSVGKVGVNHVLKFTGFMGKTQNDQSYLPVLRSDIANDPKTNYNHPNDTDDFEQELFILQYSRSLKKDTKLDVTGYYGGARGVFPFGVDDATQFVFGLTNDRYGLLTHLNIEKERWSLKGGVQAYKFDRSNFEYIAPDESHPYDRDHSDKFEVSAFTKFNYKLENFDLYGNIQIRNTDLKLSKDQELDTGISFEKRWLFLNWVGGLNYNLNSNQSIYASYGRTGREPTRSDIRNGVTVEEFVNDLELGWRYNTDNWKIAANIFHMTFKNEISQVGALMENSYMDIRQNVPNSRRSGIELQLMHRPSHKFSFHMNAAFMSSNVSEFDAGDRIFQNVNHIFAPKWVIRPQANFTFSDRIGMILSGRHVSQSYMELANLPSFELPTHTVLNAQIDIGLTKAINMSFIVNNLFNELYFTDGAPVDFNFDGIVEGPGYRIQPPRHFYVTFKINL